MTVTAHTCPRDESPCAVAYICIPSSHAPIAYYDRALTSLPNPRYIVLECLTYLNSYIQVYDLALGQVVRNIQLVSVHLLGSG